MAEPSSSSLKPADSAASIHANGKLKGRSAGRRNASPGQGFLAWFLSLVARLATWAAILTILFRCPSSLEACDDDSPFICKHYFRAKNAVSPHLEPYYDQYAAPYVNVARPYYDTVNNRVLLPTRVYAIHYGAPWVKKGRDYAWSRWETNALPQLARLQASSQARYEQSVAPHLARASEAVGPYYEIARTNSLQLFYEYILPSYNFVRPYAAQGYDATSHFAANTALPASYWVWSKASVFLDTAVWPQLRAVYVGNVEPQLVRIGERLGRYKNKAKTKVLRGQPSAHTTSAEAIASAFSKPAPQRTTLPATTTTEASTGDNTRDHTGGSSANHTKDDESASGGVERPHLQETADEHRSPVETTPADGSESEVRQRARDMVARDLDMWQKKFAAHAHEGAADIEDRIDEIARRMIEDKARVTGKGLVEQLEATVAAELADVKRKILAIVGKGPKDAEDKAVSAIRAAGAAIKKQAQMIRGWREAYDSELRETASDAANVHCQILDETRGLALQQIGMRWAWADGVTFKDWAKYHEMKSTLTQWTEELKQAIVAHPTLLAAQDASVQIEDEAMVVAAAAARELARLKDVARWKILARDSTDSFDSDSMRRAAEAAQNTDGANETDAGLLDQAKSAVKDAAEQASSSVKDFCSATEEAVLESVSSVAGTAAEATSSVAGAAGVASAAIKAQKKPAGQAFSGQESEEDEDGDGGVQEKPLTMEETVSSTTTETETVLLGRKGVTDSSESVDSSGTVVEDTLSNDEEASVSPLAGASAALMEGAGTLGDNGTPEELASEEEDNSDDSPKNRAARGKKVAEADAPRANAPAFGAAAESVSDRRPVLEDYVDPDTIAGATTAAQAAYSSAVSVASERYSSALSVVSAQVYGTPKPVHEQLFSSVSAAYDKAVAAASHKLEEAVNAASSGVYGKPTPASSSKPLGWDKAESMAAQRLNEGRLWAEIQYQSALIAMGMATPTPTSTAEKFVDQAKMNYYAGLGLAHDRYMSFIAAASSAWSSMTATPTPTDLVGSASSMASVASESASSVARAAGEAAQSVYLAATDGVISAAEVVEDTLSAAADAAGEQIYIAGAAVAETWDKVLSELGDQVYGEPTAIGWYDNACAAATKTVADSLSSATDAAQDAAVTTSAKAARQYEAVREMMSELVSGRQPAFSESVLSRLSAIYATAAASAGSLASEASAAAASVGDRVGSSASRATEAVKESRQQGKDEL